jgi:hypothetical protein
LFAAYPPAHDKHFGDHVTLVFGISDHDVGDESDATVVIVDRFVSTDADVFTVSVNGAGTRGDGKPYHLTWSMASASGKGPRHSVDAITECNHNAEVGWTETLPVGFLPFTQ